MRYAEGILNEAGVLHSPQKRGRPYRNGGDPIRANNKAEQAAGDISDREYTINAAEA